MSRKMKQHQIGDNHPCRVLMVGNHHQWREVMVGRREAQFGHTHQWREHQVGENNLWGGPQVHEMVTWIGATIFATWVSRNWHEMHRKLCNHVFIFMFLVC